jgi:hypothetical protein
MNIVYFMAELLGLECGFRQSSTSSFRESTIRARVRCRRQSSRAEWGQNNLRAIEGSGGAVATRSSGVLMSARSIFFAACLGVLLGIAAPAHAQSLRPPGSPRSVKDNIYMIRNMGAGNITMLVGQST